MRVLLAEDDDRIASDVAAALEVAGFAIDRQSDGVEVWHRGDTEAYDAVVLDLGLPNLDGMSVLKNWRRADRRMPVLVLTARGNWQERVDGIDAGADDYLVKPFRIEEVVARVRALVRRASGSPVPIISVGDISLDTRQMLASRNGRPIALAPQEYRLFSYLMHHRGRVVDQVELTEHLYLQDFERDSNSVEALVARVRRKIGNNVIETRRGFGYIIREREV